MKATKIDLLVCSFCKLGEISSSDNATVMQCDGESCEACLDFYKDIVESMEGEEK